MEKASLTANSFGAALRINMQGATKDLDAFTDDSFWPRFVPGVELEAGEPEHNPDLDIRFDSEAAWRLDPATHELICPPGNIIHAVCAAGYMLDAKRQDSGLYTLHGNVIANPTGAVALLGPISGLGKTGLSSLAADRDWQWVSDEKFVMNHQGEYVGSVAGILQDEKTRQSAGDNEPGVSRTLNRQIGAFVIPIVTDGETLVSHPYDHEKAFWHLHEEMSRDVRMAPLALDGPDVPLPSFDSDNIAIKRRKAAAALSGKIPFISVMGSGEAILDYLSETIR